jgi:protein-S-isoprenylcysteine O-methyltransferase Ste14
MVDIRIPIGLMFSILGVLITGYGLFTVSNVELYRKSLGHNVNIIMGILMLIFGLIMLYFAWRKKKTSIKQQ